MIIATAGHVDHGKTALVRALTGVDTDRLPEERARGLTIDLGFAYAPLPDGRLIGFVDVPGHQRFIKNMLAGVSNVDHALLVVAAFSRHHDALTWASARLARDFGPVALASAVYPFDQTGYY